METEDKVWLIIDTVVLTLLVVTLTIAHIKSGQEDAIVDKNQIIEKGETSLYLTIEDEHGDREIYRIDGKNDLTLSVEIKSSPEKIEINSAPVKLITE